MKILVTGMTSAQTRENDTIAGALAHCLRESGHEVTCGRPSLEQMLDGERWDHVFVGLGPLHGIGSSMKYGALGTIGTHWDRCTFYLDDIDSSKIGSGLRIMQRYNWKLTKPFYGYCREYDVATRPGVANWLLEVIDWMLGSEVEEQPRMLIPAFTFDDAFRTAQKISPVAAERVMPIDWSAYAPRLKNVCRDLVDKYGEPNEELPEGSWWSVERAPENVHVRSLGPFSWPVVQTSGRSLPVLLKSSGSLAPGTAWTPRFYQASEAGMVMVAPWQVFADYVGESFEVLASEIEVMSSDERQQLAEFQLKQLNSFVPTQAELVKILEGHLHLEDKPKET